MQMNDMKRMILQRMKDDIGIRWFTADIILMTFEYKDIPMAEQCLIDLSRNGIILQRSVPYGKIMVTEYVYTPPPPPTLRVIENDKQNDKSRPGS